MLPYLNQEWGIFLHRIRVSFASHFQSPGPKDVRDEVCSSVGIYIIPSIPFDLVASELFHRVVTTPKASSYTISDLPLLLSHALAYLSFIVGKQLFNLIMATRLSHNTAL